MLIQRRPLTLLINQALPFVWMALEEEYCKRKLSLKNFTMDINCLNKTGFMFYSRR